MVPSHSCVKIMMEMDPHRPPISAVVAQTILDGQGLPDVFQASEQVFLSHQSSVKAANAPIYMH